MSLRGNIIVVSGPSGAGKSTVIKQLLQRRDDLFFSVSATTRAIRPCETDGVNYHFVSQEVFDGMVSRGELLEYAGYVNHYYGTPAIPIEEALKNGRVVLLDIEVQGALRIKELMPEAVLVFLMPCKLETLRKRLLKRSTEDAHTVEERIRTALSELKQIDKYDYIVFNDRLQDAVQELGAIITAEKCRRSKRVPLIDSI